MGTKVQDVGTEATKLSVNRRKSALGQSIILVKKEHVLAGRGKNAVATSTQGAAVLVAVNRAHPRIPREHIVELVSGTLRIPAVNDDDLNVIAPLRKDALDCLADVGKATVIRNDDRKTGTHSRPLAS